MPASLPTYPVPVYLQTGADFASASGGTVSWPSQVQEGDIGLLIVETSDGNASLTTDAGFVAISGSPLQISTETRLAVYWCRAASDTPTDPVLGDSGNHQIANILLIRGCAADRNPIHVVGTTNAPGPTANGMSLTGLTTTIDNCLIMLIAGMGIDNATADLVTNWANADLDWILEIGERGTTTGDGGYHASARGAKYTAGAVGASTASRSAPAATASYNGFAIALMPPQFDTTDPEVTAVTAEGAIDAADPIELEVTDDFDNLAQVVITATYGADFVGGAITELVYDGTSFAADFVGASTTGAITDGVEFSLERAGGWPSEDVTINVVAIDDQGNAGTDSLVYTTDFVAPTASPSVAAYSPAPGAIADDDSIQIDVTDVDADLQRIVVSAVRDDGTTELIHDGLTSGFEAPYDADSTNTAIANGRRLVVSRTGGWGTSNITLNVLAIDEGGREGTRTGDFTTDFAAPAGPVITGVTAEGEVAVDDPIELEVTDADDDLGEVSITATYGSDFEAGALTETIYEGGAFTAPFAAGSEADPITNGLGFILARDGGWPSADVTIKVTAVDDGGRSSTEELVYTTPFEPDVEGDVTAPTVTVVSPLSGQVQRYTPIVVDIDEETELSLVVVLAKIYDPTSGRLISDEPVFVGSNFRTNYRATSQVEETETGLRLTILRVGGWPGRPVLEFPIRDTSGNAAEVAP